MLDTTTEAARTTPSVSMLMGSVVRVAFGFSCPWAV